MSAREKEIYDYYEEHGTEKAVAHFGLSKAYIYGVASRYRKTLKSEPAPQPAPQPAPEPAPEPKKKFIIKKKPTPPPTPEPAPAPEPDWMSYLEVAKSKAKTALETLKQATPPPTPERHSFGYKGFGCDFYRTARFFIERLHPYNNQAIWNLFRMILENGGDLEVISPYHSKDGKDYYFSIRINTDVCFYTAHIHGSLIGSRFNLERVVAFYRNDSYEMIFTKSE